MPGPTTAAPRDTMSNNILPPSADSATGGVPRHPPSADRVQVLDKGDEPLAAFLERAAAHCSAQGGKLTPLRLAVLSLLWEADQPIGAYEVIRRLNAREGRKIGPPTIYRALDYLQQAGLAARIESRNAFTACSHPEDQHACIFLLCRTCGDAREFVDPELEARLNADVAALGFAPEQRFLEVVGLCPDCQTAPGRHRQS